MNQNQMVKRDLPDNQQPFARRCGACGHITSEVSFQAMKFQLPCSNPRCPDPKQAYSEKLYAATWLDRGN